LTPGQTAKLHTHAREEKTYLVLSGEGVIRVGDEEHRVRTGHLVHCPTGVPHGATNDGAENLRLLVVMAPHPKH
jgi:mannose-6-phosphate isomerase-like protein (cupin superfamily)